MWEFAVTGDMIPSVEYIVCGFSVLHQTYDRISYTVVQERGTCNIVHHALYVTGVLPFSGPGPISKRRISSNPLSS
jgi:hypothetical protein